MRWLMIAIFLAPALVQAEERKLNGAEISDLLPKVLATSETTRQTFDRDGRTDFDDGRRPTVGRWRVQNDAYCSLWPPSDLWRCYDVLIDGGNGDEPKKIIWIDIELNDRTVNTMLWRD